MSAIQTESAHVPGAVLLALLSLALSGESSGCSRSDRGDAGRVGIRERAGDPLDLQDDNVDGLLDYVAEAHRNLEITRRLPG